MKIAIIGSGISGLVAAYHLHRSHDVTVLEANDYIGGHANTADVKMEGQSYAIDTGFIVFNDWTYPNFIQLLDELGVESQATEMSFSVRDDKSGLEYNGHNLNTLFAQRKNLVKPSFLKMIYDILRFNRQAKEMDFVDCNLTVGEFIERNGFSKSFRKHYLLPMGAAIWSCPTGVFADFPIRFIAEFYKNHGLLNIGNRPTWRVIRGGSKSYVDALTQRIRDRIQLSCPVVSVRRIQRQEAGTFDVGEPKQAVEVTFKNKETPNQRQETLEFDHVIFACHSDQALRILGSGATTTETELLSAFPYSRNVAVLHTDESVLPKNRRAWASWNYRVDGNDDEPASLTYNMSLLQQISSPHTFCVTLNGEEQIDPAKIVQSQVYHHPVFTSQRSAAQQRHHELINVNQTSFCGAYWRNGFHEDGVVSALAVVNQLANSTNESTRPRNRSAKAVS